MRTLTFRVVFTGEDGRQVDTPRLMINVPDNITFPTTTARSQLDDVLAMVVAEGVSWEVFFIHST